MKQYKANTKYDTIVYKNLIQKLGIDGKVHCKKKKKIEAKQRIVDDVDDDVDNHNEHKIREQKKNSDKILFLFWLLLSASTFT